MKVLITSLLLVVWVTAFGQRKYAEYKDEDRIVLLEQKKIKKNMIDVSGFTFNDSITRRPLFLEEKNLKQFKFPLDTAKNFEIELFVRINYRKGLLSIWGAAHPEENDPKHDSEKDTQYQMDLWADGIYNVLHRVYNILIGIKDLKKILTDDDPEHRLLTIRKVNKEVQFFVNRNLLLTILPPEDINEIGINIKDKGVQIESLRISYLTH